MQISSLQSSSLFADLASVSTSSTSSTSSSNQSPFDAALTNLMSAIKSGDSSDAKKYLAEVEKLQPANADANSPLGEFLSSVTTALSDNNMTAAQSSLTTLESYAVPSADSSGTATGTTSSTADSTGTTSLSAVGQDVITLFGAISSGNTSEAQSAYDSLTSLLDSANSSNSLLSTSDSSTSSTTSFTTLLANIGSALSNGNITSAQSSLDRFLQNLSSGTFVNTTA